MPFHWPALRLVFGLVEPLSLAIWAVTLLVVVGMVGGAIYEARRAPRTGAG